MSTYLSVKEVSEVLNVSEQHVRTLCRNQSLDAEKFGNSWMVSKESIEKCGLLNSYTVAEDHVAYDIGKSKKPIALSFFSGAMGLDLGIKKAGFDVRLACEVDKFCRQTIAINSPKTALLSDVNDYEVQDILDACKLTKDDEIDLIVGGPPCQAFSTAGKRQGFNDERGNVFIKYLDLCLGLNPKYFIIENVRGLLSCPMQHRPHDQRGSDCPDLSEDELKGGALNFILHKLENSGYGYSFNLYNSANFGSPQIRERVIIVCSRDGKKAPYLTPTHSQDGSNGLKKWKTFKSAVSQIKTCNHLNFPEKRLKYYRLLKAGENWKNLPVELQKEAMGKSYYSGGGKTGFLRRLAWNKPSPTLLTHPAMPATDLSHPEEDRPLSVEEYKRVQEFPDKWELAGPIIQQYKQVGNAVPVSLGNAVGVLIMNLLNNCTPQPPDNFRFSRYRKTSDIEWKENFNELIKEKNRPNLQPEFDF